MCLVVWVAAARPLPVTLLPDRRPPDPVRGYHQIVPAAPDAAVRARFTLPFVSEVGSHEGCGCGYNSGTLTGQGFATPDEVRSLLAAMTDDERTEWEAEQGSRERLRDLVRGALRDGPVEVFGCWSGDEGEPAIGVAEVEASHFADRIAPIEEGLLYRVRAGCSA